jgi:acetyl esterase/lipase
MRFSLSQLHVWHPPDRYVGSLLSYFLPNKYLSLTYVICITNYGRYPEWTLAEKYRNEEKVAKKSTNGKRFGIRGHVHEIYHQMSTKRTLTVFQEEAEKSTSMEEMTVTGLFVQHLPQPSQKVIFWIYGGAFLAGDSRGNLGIAEKMGMMCAVDGRSSDSSSDNGMRDVFIPDYRLVPEHHLDDAIHDVTLAYEYLLYERNIRPENITLVGVSSGGGLVVLLLQALAKAKQKFDKSENLSTGDDKSTKRFVPMPAGGVMIGPFVDYSEPKGSMKQFIKHDLIVNQVCACFLTFWNSNHFVRA